MIDSLRHSFGITALGVFLLTLGVELNSGVATPHNENAGLGVQLSAVNGSAKWDWKPWWRSKSDCGPVALYALLSLEGFTVDYRMLSSEIPLDSKRGCSLGDLRRAALSLGAATETRFVNPDALAKLRMPYILHGNQSIEKDYGHFVIVVAYDQEKDLFAIVDPIRQSFNWGNGRLIRRDFSGYTMRVKKAFSESRWGGDTGGYVIFLLVVLTAIRLIPLKRVQSPHYDIGGPALKQASSTL